MREDEWDQDGTRLFRSENYMPWSEQYRIAGEDWADKEAAAQLLEDTKTAIMAQWQVELGDIPVNRAEQTVKASKRWQDHIEKIVEARKAANVAKIQLETLRMRAFEHHDQSANQRTEMRMLGR